MRVAWSATILVLVATACLGGSDAPVKEREEVLLGIIADLDNAAQQSIARGVDMALFRYNNDPDRTYDVRARRFNTKGEGGAAAAATRAVATERLIGVVGPLSDADAIAAAPVLSQSGMPSMIPTASSMSVKLPGWQGFRRLVANRDQLAALLLLDAAARTKGSVAIFHGADPETVSALQAARASADKAKIQVTRQEAVSDKGDLKPLATSIVQAPPPAIVLYGPPARSKALIDLVRQAGYKGLVAAERMKEVPQPPADCLTASGEADPGSAVLEVIAELYSRRYGGAMPSFAAESYEAASMLLEAIEEVDPDPGSIAGFLRLNRGFLGDTKRYDFDEEGEMITPPGWIYVSKQGWRLSGVADPGKRVPTEDS